MPPGPARFSFSSWKSVPWQTDDSRRPAFFNWLHRYRYESNVDSFVAEPEVDEIGLVRRHEGDWERIATIDAPR